MDPGNAYMGESGDMNSAFTDYMDNVHRSKERRLSWIKMYVCTDNHPYHFFNHIAC